jgi:MoxR-like ATPase
LHASLQPLAAAIGQHFRGSPAILELVLTALLARGHILIEDVPGVGKTTLAYVLAKALRQEVSRIQFTSDLLPSDILGVSIYEGPERGFRFHPGPIFADIVLADEINRAAPRTQSALLEAMERGKVTVEGTTHSLSDRFLVLATQNPVDLESTFPLPEAQLDRFALRISLGYPSEEAERELMRRAPGRYDEMIPAETFDWSLIADLRSRVDEVFLEESLLDYIHRLVRATREDRRLLVGVSPRGASLFCHLLRARAVVAGRDFVAPEDLAFLALPALAHRLISSPLTGAEEPGQLHRTLLREYLGREPLPHVRV